MAAPTTEDHASLNKTRVCDPPRDPRGWAHVCYVNRPWSHTRPHEAQVPGLVRAE